MKSKSIKELEVLSPAGSYDAMRAAINAGADAVYIGGELFGARAFAENFNTEQIKETLDFAHIRNKKIYLTVNTLLKNKEIYEELYDYIYPLYEYGLDAVIVQDYGVMKFMLDNFPDMSVHASTQMAVMGINTALELEKAGVKRIVLPREMTLKQIKEFRDNTNLEIETFVHGALCYCYSGQCLFSSFIGGRSGNRGRCAQPCRQAYDVILNKKCINNYNEKYVISPKDICTLDILPEIIEAGTMSLKIEGRMKKPEYTALVTEKYRKYADMYMEYGKDKYKVDAYDIEELMDIFNRNGFFGGYYKGNTGRNMISLKKPAFRTQNEKLINRINSEYMNGDSKVSVNARAVITNNKPAELSVWTNDKRFSIRVDTEIPDKARKQPLDYESVRKQIEKTGDTPFVISELDIQLDDNLFMTVGDLKNLRRNALKSLEDKITDSYKRYKIHNITKKEIQNKNFKQNEDNYSLRCKVETIEQAEFILNMKKSDLFEKLCNADVLYVSYKCFEDYDRIAELADKAHNNQVKIYYAFPHIFEKKVLGSNRQIKNALKVADGWLIRNIEQYFLIKEKSQNPIILDYNVYVFNDFSKQFIEDLKISGYTIPLELSYNERANMSDELAEEVIYGYLPAMVTKGCIYKTMNICGNKGNLVIKDKYEYNFKVKQYCGDCYNVIYNSVPIGLFEFMDEILNNHTKKIRLEFIDETSEQIEKVFDCLNNKTRMDGATKGHYMRGVD
ncbi:MAG: U32 family peptidase [Eubacterium sp.]